MANNIEDIIKQVCLDDLSESEDKDYTEEEMKEIVTPGLVSNIISKVWEAEEGLLWEAVDKWELKNENKSNR